MESETVPAATALVLCCCWGCCRAGDVVQLEVVECVLVVVVRLVAAGEFARWAYFAGSVAAASLLFCGPALINQHTVTEETWMKP